MKVAMQGQTAVAANSTNDNVLTGQRYERAPWPALGALYVNGSATGLKAELNVGGTSITPPVTCNVQNRSPVVPDDTLIDQWEVLPNALLQLTITNTTGGALTAFWRVDLQEVEIPGYNA
jgi:hypothetical protein